MKRERKAKAPETTLPEWVHALGPKEPAIPPDDPIFLWATAQGIPHLWLSYAWAAFEDRYTTNGKRQADWRQVFRNAIKGDWLSIWRMTPSGPVLTTVGEQWRKVA